ncbi:MAG: hypothetical protein Q8M31_22115 [Beijerinckiaceae bacterium]|nr:hypothetical protein [Beijerinckiaceae bacterium]
MSNALPSSATVDKTDKVDTKTAGTNGKPDDLARNPDAKRKPGDPPAAGPHAKPELTNPESTPGSGLLPDPAHPSDAPDSASS